jgi:hypothetical protein
LLLLDTDYAKSHRRVAAEDFYIGDKADDIFINPDGEVAVDGVGQDRVSRWAVEFPGAVLFPFKFLSE